MNDNTNSDANDEASSEQSQPREDVTTGFFISPETEQAIQTMTSQLDRFQSDLVSSFSISSEMEDTIQELSLLLDIYENTFTLLLARCNYANLRDRAIARLREISAVPIRQVSIERTTSSIYQLIQPEGSTDNSSIMVTGIELSQNIDGLVKGLNQIREEFRKNCHFQIVLWINDDILKRMIRIAPDFESWTTTIELAIAGNDLKESLYSGTEALFSMALSAKMIDPSYSLGRISHLGGIYLSELDLALRDLRNQGQAIAPGLQAGLDFIRGMNTADFSTSLSYLQSSYQYWESIQNFERQGLLLYQIGRRRYHLTKLEKHSHEENWQTVQDLFFRSLACFEIADRPDLMSECYLQLQRTLHHLQSWKELKALSHKALSIHQTQPHHLASDYGFLAEVALIEQQWQTAQEYAEQALSLLPQSPDTYHWLYGLYWCYLAEAQIQLEHPESALENLLKARKRDHCGHPHMYIRILNQLRDLYFVQGRYLEAFQTKQERLAIEQRYGYRAFIGAGQLQSCLEEYSSFAGQKNRFIISPEIYASGRKQDLDELTRRISEPRYKLIVLHGNSGVGKSSFVNAGLMPALQQTIYGGRTVIPISQKVYTSWELELINLLKDALESLSLNSAPLLANPIASATLNKHSENKHSDKPSLCDRIIEQLRWNESHNFRSVLIFDQFEEFFFVHQYQVSERQRFFEFLGSLLSDFQYLSSLKVVLSLREDYIHYLLEGNRIANMSAIDNDILSKNVLYQMGNFSTAAAHSTIRTLTERAQFYLEPQLIDLLVRDLTNEQDEVRPIELQIVGAQLQQDQISTVMQYQKLGKHPTEKLVQRYLDSVVCDCGKENYRLTNLILYLLTDEKGTRPLKTYGDLERELYNLDREVREQGQTLPNFGAPEIPEAPKHDEFEIAKIELVLQILIGSGLVVLIPEATTNRCQLVHDYLAVIIRKSQSPELQKLQKELEKTQTELRQTVRQLESSLKNSQAIADSLALNSLLSNRLLDLSELSKAIQMATKWLPEIQAIASETRWQLTSTIYRAIYEIKERNRIHSHLEGVWSAEYNADASLFVTGGLDNKIKIWQANGTQIGELIGHTGAIRSASFSPDGQMILSSSSDKTIGLWNLQGDRLHTFTGHTGAVWSARFSADGKLIVSGSADKTIKLWQIDGNEIQTLNGHRGDVRNVLFSPNGELLISGGSDKNIMIWSLDGKLLQTLKGHTADIRCLSLSANGMLIASGSGDNVLKIWQMEMGIESDLQNLQVTEIRSIQAHTSAIRSLSFSPDSNILATGSADKNIKLWDLQGHELQTIKGHDEAVRSVSFSPDGKNLLSASLDCTVRLWEINNRVQQLWDGHSAAVRTVAISPDGQSFVSGSLDKCIKIWDMQGNLCQTIECEHDILSISFSPDGQTLAVGSGDKAIALWSMGTHPQLQQSLVGHSTAVWTVDFSPDGQKVVSGSGDKLVKIWQVDGTGNGTELCSLSGHRSTIWTVKFSPDGQKVLSGSGDDTVKIWSIDGQELATLRDHRGAVWSACFSPDGELVLSGSSDNTLKLWNLAGELIHTFRGHESVVWAVGFSPDGRNIISGSSDNTIRLWNLDGKELQTLSCPDHTPISLCFRSNGYGFVSGHGSNAIGLWNFDLAHLIKQGEAWLQDYWQQM